MTRSVQFSQAIRSWMDAFMHRSMRGWGLFAKSTGLSMPQFSVLMQLHYRGAKLLNLTDRGKELIQQGIEERYRWVDQLEERLTAEESVQISEALNIMTRAAQELEAELVQPVA